MSTLSALESALEQNAIGIIVRLLRDGPHCRDGGCKDEQFSLSNSGHLFSRYIG